MSQNNKQHFGEPIAIVGSGCRFPGSANSPSKLWSLLENPRDLLRPIPKERYNNENFYHPNAAHHGTGNIKDSYLLDEDVRQFDAGFFNIKGIEVPAIDPQQRLLMETIFESIEAAGLSMESLAGSQTGVYVGLMCADYVDILNSDVNSMPTYTPTGTARSIMSNRISYFFDWHGPSMTIDTACSSSLVAVHQAVQLLRSGDSDVAVAAGANLILGPGNYIGSSKLNMLSADSRSRMWDADASGYARGEGIAAVVLKRLSQAIADGDNIECIIRETGVNQDGRTKGITMPSQTAQADLIARTYGKCGLDPRNPRERCQYFEAHGTGTAAGDPKEAEAISIAFFNPGERLESGQDPLFVGSVKTVIGHTEGTAGIAGLLKASLAIQHGIVPPNLLFNKLSNTVEPFYHNLEIATTAKPWPKVPEGVPRRASCNSFGFGGTNAHIILEQFDAGSAKLVVATPSVSFAPFVFSAASERSLQGVLADFANYVRANPPVNLANIAYTMYARKTTHAVRISISARSTDELLNKIDDVLTKAKDNSIGTRPQTLKNNARILGVFTGQGAQWATMGRELILASVYAKTLVQDLDLMLQKLPEGERPTWSIYEQLTCDTKDSRISSAVIAQPLCTVIQVVLYDFLRSAGVDFSAVVGHSSGEIAAAYAAGLLSREDTVKIAYYRGFYTSLTPSSTPGAMMAAGTSFEDADDLCNLSMFEGRLCVAAINSPTSVTLSGDREAIEQAEEVLKDEGKFARILKVDKAYHSHHMLPCSEPYLDALQRNNIVMKTPEKGPMWFSSVYEGRIIHQDKDISGTYWRDNLVRPVLFKNAIDSALESQAFDAAIEIGPHPTLKALVLEMLQQKHKTTMPYTGLLQRGADDVKAFADALGYLWSHFSPSSIRFADFDVLTSGQDRRKFLNGLPTYSWEHEKLYWHESRASRAYLNETNVSHPLLGKRTTDAMDQEIRWRNLLRVSELPWIPGHSLQGQVIYPATGYLSTAIEAALQIVPEGNISVIEVEDFEIGKPLVFGDDDAGIETLFTLGSIKKESSDTYSATFAYHACTNVEVAQLSKHATGKITVKMGTTSVNSLPSNNNNPPNLTSVTSERFYSSLETLGYQYSGQFKALSAIRRKLDFATAHVLVPPQDDEPTSILLHPALLDCALQGIFLAYCWPNDGSLDLLHVPTGIGKIRINVGLCKEDVVSGTNLTLCSHLTGDPLVTKNIHGDVDLFSEDGVGLIQMEAVKVVAFAEPTPEMDHAVFTEPIWSVATPDVDLAMDGARASAQDYEFSFAMERVSVNYMRQMVAEFPPEKRATMNLEWNFERMFEYFEHVLSGIAAGTRQFSEKKWLDDTPEEIAALKAQWWHRIDMHLNCTVGDNLAAVIRGETTILEHMTKDDLLYRFYETGLGLQEFASFLAKTVKQLTHRYPRMNILEIGAGTGGTTKRVMGEIGPTFATYTFTDISTGFFETMQEWFGSHGEKMIYKTLDIERDIVEQGYVEHSYDLVIASLVIHATTNIEQALKNARRLLKPGGYLIIQELLENDVVRVAFSMCALPGWWLGENDGRRLSPCANSAEWHRLLTRSGFSGADSLTRETDEVPFPLTVIMSQAIDDQFITLREPLATVDQWANDCDLIIIGGQSLNTIPVVERTVSIMKGIGIKTTVFRSLVDVETSKISNNSAILCLTELDAPVFERLTEKVMDGMKRLFETERVVLWITRGCRAEEPYMNMSIGFGRSLLLENPDLCLQFLDLEPGLKPKSEVLVEAVMKLYIGRQWERDGTLENVLWTNENELAFEGDALIVSRIHHIKSYNDRYNASRRTIVKDELPQQTPLALEITSSAYTVTYDDQVLNVHTGSIKSAESDKILIQVTHSISSPVLTTLTNELVLVYGLKVDDKSSVIALSDTNSSFVLTDEDLTFSVDIASGLEAQVLANISAQIQCEVFLRICGKSSIAVIHEPETIFANVLASRAKEVDVTVFYTTTRSHEDNLPWIKVDSLSPQRVLRAALPSNVSVFLSNLPDADGLADRIKSCLPSTCLTTTLATVYKLLHGANLGDIMSGERLNEIVRIGSAQHPNTATTVTVQTVKLDSLLGQSVTELQSRVIVDWQSSAKVPVQVTSVDPHVKFRSDRTYVLFGLTSDLAQSLCDWMAAHGAQNIVLTSRTPKVDVTWLELMRLKGVRVQVFANDITNKASVVELVNHIKANFPPIAGIAHGAMVLNDTSFFDMSLETMNQVLRPKVQGAIVLDELFQDKSLDFFIFFSSITAIAGNRGQSAYTAANMFMTALASQRRKKGLAASILHICAVVGVGYVNRGFSESIFDALRKVGYMRMSERWLRLCFAEAILASDPRSERGSEVITGVDTTGLDGVIPVWAKYARFSHCLKHEDSSGGKTQKRSNAVSTQVKLAEATTGDEVLEILQDAFFLKLQTALQIPPETSKESILRSGTDELGLDSLVAVEIRSWFLKELTIEIPVLKILSGGSVSQLLDFAVEKIPAALTPKLNTNTPSTRDTSRLLLAPSANNGSSDSGSISKDDGSTDGHDTQSVSSAPTTDAGASVKEYTKTLPMSSGQTGFWVLKHLIKDETTSNITISVVIEGNIRVNSMKSALATVASRHEAFRSSFFVNDGHAPVQAISDDSKLSLEIIRISDKAEVVTHYDALKSYVYKIEDGDCMRLVYLERSAQESYLLIGAHHIIMDGISLEIFLDELQRAYNHQTLPGPVYQYSDYSSRMVQDLKAGKMDSELDYWKSQFVNQPLPLPLLEFASVKTRTPLMSYDYNSASRNVDATITKQVKYTCTTMKSNVFHLYLGVFEVLLYKLFNINDLCIGMADANRWDPQVAKSMGMYLNLLPLRFQLNGSQSFATLLKNTRKTAYSAMSNSKVPFDVVLENVKFERSTTHTPLFQAFINYRQGVDEKRKFGEATASTLNMSNARTGYDISLDIFDNPSGDPRIVVMVQKQLYSSEDASRILDMYLKLLADLSFSPETAVEDVVLHAQPDVENAIHLGHGHELTTRWPDTLPHRIEEVINIYPHEPAVKTDSGRSWTYAQLSQEVDRIAAFLLDSNVRAGANIAVLQEPSPAVVFSLLAITRIGAVHIPLDHTLPATRLNTILKATNPAVLLLDQFTQSRLAELDRAPECLAAAVEQLPTSKSRTPILSESAQPAVILFTSGSTGVPKGVVLSHAGLRNQEEIVTSRHGYGKEVVLQQSSTSFDMSLHQTFLALSNGGTLVIVSHALRKDPQAVSKILLDNDITYTIATPSEYSSWMRHGSDSLTKSKSWKTAMTGGEQFPTRLINEFRQLRSSYEHNFRIFNSYGPTEATMSVSDVEISLDRSEQQITVGSVLPNYSVYIVDSQLNALPVNYPGEICIASSGLATGYLNNATETKTKFVKNNLISRTQINDARSRLYRTGDKGLLHSDGRLIVLGRIDGDTQVKIRGLRVELQDIEQTLLTHAKGVLKEVVVTLREDNSVLVAHAVLFADLGERESETLASLAASLPLPQYMRPSIIIPLLALPMTSRGKVNRNAVQALPLQLTEGPVPNNLTEIETEVQEVWQVVLGNQLIGGGIAINSDFFHVGGNSLLMVELRLILNSKFNTEVTMLQLFEHSTLGGMAQLINGSKTTQATINWDLETSIAGLDLQTESIESTIESVPEVVVLTGATGFLGRQILKTLIESPTIKEVHCIAVRSIDRLSDLTTTGKVMAYTGNLSDSKLGLSDEDAAAIFSSAHTIIHNGADVSFLKTYSSLKAANVESTKYLLQQASRHNIPFHFISSATVGKLTDGEVLKRESLADHPPNADFNDGYASTKWVSEVLIDKVGRTTGQPVFIHRPSSISGEGAADTDVMDNIRRFSASIEAIPDTKDFRGYLDMISVEHAASGIVGTISQMSATGSSLGVEYLHWAGDVVVPAQSIKKVLITENNSHWETLSLEAWVLKAVGRGMNPLVGEFLSSMNAKKGIKIGQRL